jgi:hypothetical protein
MNLDAFVAVLEENPQAPLHLMLPDGSFVPAHFHVTEVGRVQKDFIDCGGTRRSTTSCVVQVSVADDTAHRLDATKLAKIIQMGTSLFPSMTVPVEVEYEQGAVSQFPVQQAEVTPSGVLLHLGSKHTACLAQDRCGVVAVETACCPTPGCC